MKLKFLGGTGTVTGSKYLVEAGSTHVMVDCGLFQGLKQLRLRNWAPPPVAPISVGAIILTHAHIDHSGYLPLMVKNGFHGPVYCTEATYELCKILLPDAGRLQEEDAAHANRHRYSKHSPALPLYTENDALEALRLFKPMPFKELFEVKGLRVSFTPAGHILGAAIITLSDGQRSVVFSGDLGREADLIMRAPEAVEKADYLLVESTYGDRRHAKDDPLDILERVIQKTVQRGGAIIIPSFAVGRAQLLMYLIQQLKAAGRISKELPVFLNSPMATDVTDIYRHFRQQHRLNPEQCQAMCHVAKIIRTVDESIQLNERHGPMIVIAGSGMATGGRVVHHLKAFAPNARNTILLTGFQSAGTRGAAMLAGAEVIRIHGEDVPVRAEVAMIDCLSAHADYEEILRWLGKFTEAPRMTFVTHGEPIAADTLRRHIQDRLHWSCSVPEYLSTINLI